VTLPPFGITIFCDDIRNEIGGKISMIGCYTGDMLISAVPPVAIPILCGVVHIRLPVDSDFKEFKVIATHEAGETITELAVAEIQVETDPDSSKLQTEDDTKEPEKQLSMVIPMKWASVKFEGETFIKIRGYMLRPA